MDGVGCQVGQVALFVDLMEGSVLTFNMSVVAKKIMETSSFVLQAMFEGYLGVSEPCILHLPCGT